MLLDFKIFKTKSKTYIYFNYSKLDQASTLTSPGVRTNKQWQTERYQ